MRLSKKILIMATSLTMFLSSISFVRADTFFPTDVTSPSENMCLIGLDGTFIIDSDAAINRINEIRLEACKEGVRNPNTGEPLTEEDYVPIKWSSDLEYIAKIRAAESLITDNHIRTNGTSCFNIKSPSGIRSYGEVLAWGGYRNIVKSINMWYGEKNDWINKTGKVTGHYTSMINPNNKYFGMGLFVPDDPTIWWDCAAGEFSSSGNHAQTVSKGNVHGIQVLELLNTSVDNISSLSGNTSGKTGETNTLSAKVVSGYESYFEDLRVLESSGWKSSDTSVAIVDNTGKVTGIGCGTAVISLTINDHSSSIEYTVSHDFGDWGITTEPGCVTKGIRSHSCKACGKTVTEEIAPLGHKWDNGTIIKDVSCTENGKKQYKCINSDCTETKEETIRATGHNMVEIEHENPTCTTNGSSTTQCTVCGYSNTDIIPATEHTNTRIINIKSSTCTETGYTGDTVCVDCGKVVKSGSVVSAKGHTKVVKNKKSATCTAAGYTGDTYCSTCGEKLSSGSSVKALGHSFGGWVTTKAATAVATGTQTRTCSRCHTKETRTIAKLATTGKLNAVSFPLKVKQSAKIQVTGLAKGDYVKTWTSSNAAYATVDKNGKVTGKKKGTVTITCTLASGKKLTAKVSVQTGTVKTTSIVVNNKNVTMKMGTSFQLLAARAPFTSQQGVTYSTKSSKIATVSKTGKITAKKPGTTYIYVKSGSKKVSVKVTVQGVPTTGLKANCTEPLTLKKGKSFTWKVTKVPTNSTDAITYTTSNKKVATVNGSGKIIGKKKGTATITAKAGSKKITLIINIS